MLIKCSVVFNLLGVFPPFGLFVFVFTVLIFIAVAYRGVFRFIEHPKLCLFVWMKNWALNSLSTCLCWCYNWIWWITGLCVCWSVFMKLAALQVSRFALTCVCVCFPFLHGSVSICIQEYFNVIGFFLCACVYVVDWPHLNVKCTLNSSVSRRCL